MNNMNHAEISFEVIDIQELDELDLDFGGCGFIFCGKA